MAYELKEGPSLRTGFREDVTVEGTHFLKCREVYYALVFPTWAEDKNQKYN